MIVLGLEYGEDFRKQRTDPFSLHRAPGHVGEPHLSNFLHPILRVIKCQKLDMEAFKEGRGNTTLAEYESAIESTRHFAEDFTTEWSDTRAYAKAIHAYTKAKFKRIRKERNEKSEL